MTPTRYGDVNHIIELLLKQIKTILGEKLVGLYLDGSLVIGDFDPGISDIDLMAALSTDLTDTGFTALKKMHVDFAAEYKEWTDRIEVCYISRDALKSTKSHTNTIANISPGEPFHKRQSDKEWLMNWYLTREKSLTIFGPDPKTIIEPISKEEFIKTVKEHANNWRKYVKNAHTRPTQAYAILTMCRALYAVTRGDQVSKKRAAHWVKQLFPQWSSLIDDAFAWRWNFRNIKTDGKDTYPQTERFVHFMIDQICK